MLAFVQALTILAAAAAAPVASSPLPVVVDGKLASVALLQASRVSSEDLKACCPGAKGGLELVFLMRPNDEPVDVTLSPQVETLIDRQPYLAADEGAGGPGPSSTSAMSTISSGCIPISPHESPKGSSLISASSSRSPEPHYRNPAKSPIR
jgi:hypothetical protein